MPQANDHSWFYDTYRSTGPGRPQPVAEEAEARRAYLRAVVTNYFPPDRNARILDIGCGAGLLLSEAATAGYCHLRGIDLSPQQVAAARAMGISEVEAGDLNVLLDNLPEASQDAIVALDVLEHFDREALPAIGRTLLRVLAPGGRLIVHVPNAASPFGGRVVHGDFTHRTPFTAGSITQLLKSCGFVTVTCHEDRPAGRHPAARLRRLGWRGIRALLRLMIAVETGDRDPTMVLTQSLFCIAERAATQPSEAALP